MSAALTLALQLASPTFDLATVEATAPVNSTGDGDEVVVRARNSNRYRLPLPIERKVDVGAGDAPASAVAAITPTGRCGLFAGERRCNTAEAARYGYGGGRDPVTLLGKLATAVTDSD